jgi:hypothetical protein
MHRVVVLDGKSATTREAVQEVQVESDHGAS